MPENRGCPNLFLTRHWSRHVKSALLHVISLARLACGHTRAWAAGSLDPHVHRQHDIDLNPLWLAASRSGMLVD